MNLNQWFEQGITSEEYIARLTEHRDAFFNIYNTFTIPKEDTNQIDKPTNVRILVLAEEWCGHCMLNIPILLNISEQGNIPIRFFPRDENLELMDNYLTNDKRIIPIFIFIDEHGKQINQWGPMAPEIADYIDHEKIKLPNPDAADYETAFKEFITTVSAAFAKDSTLWHYVYKDILKSIK